MYIYIFFFFIFSFYICFCMYCLLSLRRINFSVTVDVSVDAVTYLLYLGAHKSLVWASSIVISVVVVVVLLKPQNSFVKPRFVSRHPAESNSLSCTGHLCCFVKLCRMLLDKKIIFISFFLYFFLFVPCGGLSWLRVSFLLHVNNNNSEFI